MIYILLPVHNRKHITEQFIRCLENQTCKDFNLILIDDGSTDGTSEMVLSYLKNRADVVRGDGNLWWAGGLQAGIDFLKTKNLDDLDIILMTNDDVTISETFLETGRKLMETRRNTFLLSWIRSPEGFPEESGLIFDNHRFRFIPVSKTEEPNCLSTRGLFMHWEDILKTGNFHLRLLPHYLSDYEYTNRAFRKGLKLETSPDLLVSPDHSATGFHKISESGFSFYKKYFSMRNPANPVYLSSFIFLTTSFPFNILCLVKIWLVAFKQIIWGLLPGRS